MTETQGNPKQAAGNGSVDIHPEPSQAAGGYPLPLPSLCISLSEVCQQTLLGQHTQVKRLV